MVARVVIPFCAPPTIARAGHPGFLENMSRAKHKRVARKSGELTAEEMARMLSEVINEGFRDLNKRMDRILANLDLDISASSRR